MTIPHFEAKSYEFTPFVPARNFIGGEWRDPTGADELPVLNPRWGKAMSTVRMSTRADIDAAVKAAQAAQPKWAITPIRDRAYVFYKAREIMLRDLKELSWLVSHENGKIYAEAEAEVLKGIECVEYGCSLPNVAAGNDLEVSRGVTCRLEYAPIGIVGGIVPFNFPFMVPLWMIPQALVGGNAFLLKPSEQVPLSSLRLVEIFREAGLPDGILQIVQGGREAVEALCDHPDVGALAFVGSTRVAKMVYARACATGKRALCLGGAKNHLIVVPDADRDVAIDNIVASFSGCAGQRCMAASVLVAVGEVEDILDGIKAKASKLLPGDGIGPVNSPESVARITRYIDEAEKMGAEVAVDGRGKKGTPTGYWVGPTILDHVKPEMPAAREEIFGPVLSIVRVPNLEEAIRIENENPYGNASSIYTTSGDVAKMVMDRVEAGMCGVNVGVPVPREPFGFGGWNDSCFGAGNITGWDGYRFWTRQRKVTTKWTLQKDQTWMS